MALTPKKKKEIGLLVLLGIVLVGVVWRFVLSDDSPAPGGPPATTSVVRPRASQAVAVAAPKPGAEETVISQPLDLTTLSAKQAPSSGTGRNIFVYPPPPTPTPPPTPKPVPPPPPPPITLAAINPGSVIARTGDFTLTVIGAKMPNDARAFVNGRDLPTTWVNESQIKVSIPASTIAAAGTLNVEVRSAHDAALFSNAISLTISEPPPPPYRYVGLIIERNGTRTALLKAESDEELINIQQGKILANRWKCSKINDQTLEMVDTSINVPHILRLVTE
jgi:IPT/TIG domain